MTTKKIYIKRIVNYYNEKRELIDSTEAEKKEVQDLETAREIIKNYNIQTILNKKGISAAEEIGFIYTNKEGTILREKKTKDPFTKKEF